MLKRLANKLASKRTSNAPDPATRTAQGGADIAGKTAVIAGGAGMIGSAIVREFLVQGASVVALDMDGTALRKLESELATDRLDTMTFDLRSQDQLDKLSLPVCDVLVHAAGIQFEANSLGDTDQQWAASFDTNIVGPVRLTRKLTPLLMQAGGNVVLVTSVHANLPSRWANYSAAKAAQEAMMREWAVDLAPSGVRVNAVAPGWVNDAAKPAKLALLHGQTIPPEYIARATLFLASEANSGFTTGSVLTVDAGASLYSGRVPFDQPTSSGA